MPYLRFQMLLLTGGAWRTLLLTGGEASADYLSAQDSKPRTTDTSNTPLSSLSSLPHSRKLDSESVPNSRQNSARRQESDSYSRQNSSRRPHAVSPWPTPLSARGLSTAPLDGGEAGRSLVQEISDKITRLVESRPLQKAEFANLRLCLSMSVGFCVLACCHALSISGRTVPGTFKKLCGSILGPRQTQPGKHCRHGSRN